MAPEVAVVVDTFAEADWTADFSQVWTVHFIRWRRDWTKPKYVTTKALLIQCGCCV